MCLCEVNKPQFIKATMCLQALMVKYLEARQQNLIML